ncbi:hypothetical protein SSX86_020599 [Deinandra increscens subsp. villosa]|uniref:HTH La-type RNA-binding domain-containing protein n=1 Tax=Deinandra increscens subsp. villosa TaxID=3103831 RepID=A0AAP0GUU7_9ASTR
MTADSSNATITNSGDDGGVDSPSVRNTLPSPWAEVVRGGIEPDSVSQSPCSGSAERNRNFSDPVTAVDATSPAETQPEGGDICNAGGGLKSAWSKPSANGVVEGTTSPVMGAASWPALSESTRSGVKLVSVSSESSSKHIIDGSATVSQAPVIVQPPPKQMKPNSNSHSNPNPVRQRPMRRGGSVGGASVGHTGPPPFPLFDMYANLVPAVPEFPQPSFKNNNWSPRSNDRTSNRNPARRNNFGSRPFNFEYGGRRNHHGPRSPAAREAHRPHQIGPPSVRGFVPPPFIPHQQPYGAPMGYDMGASYVYIPALAQEQYRGGAPLFPHGASGSSLFIPYWDPFLHGSILRQIEYYFSDENLVKDNFLRSHMDDEGWVPIALIAGFQRVQKLTNDMQMILSSLQYSNFVEIQGDKVKRRTDWRKWIHVPRVTAVEEPSLQKLTLEDEPTEEQDVLANGDNSHEDPCS